MPQAIIYYKCYKKDDSCSARCGNSNHQRSEIHFDVHCFLDWPGTPAPALRPITYGNSESVPAKSTDQSPSDDGFPASLTFFLQTGADDAVPGPGRAGPETMPKIQVPTPSLSRLHILQENQFSKSLGQNFENQSISRVVRARNCSSCYAT